MSEQKATTVVRVAELADDFVLTYKNGFGDVCFGGDVRRRCNTYGSSRCGNQFSTAGPSHAFKASRKDDVTVCNYCQGTGHWKDQCPVLRRSRDKHRSFLPARLLPCLVPVFRAKAWMCGSGD